MLRVLYNNYVLKLSNSYTEDAYNFYMTMFTEMLQTTAQINYNDAQILKSATLRCTVQKLQVSSANIILKKIISIFT